MWLVHFTCPCVCLLCDCARAFLLVMATPAGLHSHSWLLAVVGLAPQAYVFVEKGGKELSGCYFVSRTCPGTSLKRWREGCVPTCLPRAMPFRPCCWGVLGLSGLFADCCTFKPLKAVIEILRRRAVKTRLRPATMTDLGASLISAVCCGTSGNSSDAIVDLVAFRMGSTPQTRSRGTSPCPWMIT